MAGYLQSPTLFSVHPLDPNPPTPAVRLELLSLLRNDPRQLGAVQRAEDSGATTAKAMQELGVSKNLGTIYALIRSRCAIVDSIYPRNAGNCRQAAWSINSFLSNDDISPETRSYLTTLQQGLFNQADKIEETRLVKPDAESAAVLEKKAEDLPGVYVYSFRQYLLHPKNSSTRQCLLKVGSTSKSAWRRVVSQVRQTAMPEDPTILRVYHSEKYTPEELESLFHAILDAAGHERSSTEHTKAGVEWFSTTLTFLDTFASSLEVSIESLDEDDPEEYLDPQ